MKIFFRITNPMPSSPVPNKSMLSGSGVTAVVPRFASGPVPKLTSTLENSAAVKFVEAVTAESVRKKLAGPIIKGSKLLFAREFPEPAVPDEGRIM